MTLRIPRRQYADLYGPTVGDRVRLADTDLLIRIERDLTTPGEEAKFGGGKVIRDGMGQSTRATRAEATLDTVITNAVIIDHWGIVKADIGIRDGRIVAVGKAGNPDLMAGVTPGMVIGAGTEVIAGEGKIVTAGGLDSHIHFICPQIVTEAISAGLTTLVGGGTGPATGTAATTCTPGEWNIHRMLEAAEEFPINLGFLGKGNASAPDPLREQIAAGVIGLKLHEDWGTTPAAIDCALSVAEEYDVQVAIHTDTLNEAGFVEDSIRAFKGRTIHTYHTEGAGGGHAPDILRVVGEPNCLPSSTNPTMPFTVNTMDEHLDMLMVCHHLNAAIPEDLAFAESRIRAETIAAEDVLHDLGAISMMSSDSQAMGRIGEVIIRTWQTADKMKKQRGALTGETSGDDNRRVKRYVAKYTINPAIAHGLSEHVGSIEVGQARRPRGVEAGLLRREAGAGGQGRSDRLGRHGRSQRLDPDPSAGALPPDVRGAGPGAQLDLGHVRVGGRAGRRRPAPVGARAPGAGGGTVPRPEQARHDSQRRGAADRGGSGDVRSPGRRRAADLRAGPRSSHGPALLPVLIVSATIVTDRPDRRGRGAPAASSATCWC